MPAVRTPEAPQRTCHAVYWNVAFSIERLDRLLSTTFDFGANAPFTFVPAYGLPVYASQCIVTDTPRKTRYAVAG